MKPIRSIINDGVYRVSLVASSPTRILPQVTGGFTNLINIREQKVKRIRKL